MKCPSVLIVEEIEPFLCFVQEEMEAKIKHVDTIFCLLSTYLQNFKIFKIYNLIMGMWEYEKNNNLILSRSDVGSPNFLVQETKWQNYP